MQKDWAVVKSFNPPNHLSIAVIAHKGWNNGTDAARYTPAVTFELVNLKVKIYDDLMAEIHNLKQ